MVDKIKVGILERNGTELDFVQEYNLNAETIRMTDSDSSSVKSNIGLAKENPRTFCYFWEYNTNATPKYFLKFGQVRSDVGPFIVAVPSTLREFTCGGKLNNVNANASFTIYKNTTGVAPVTFGSRASVTNQGLTYIEGHYPYIDSSRVTINLVNNGASLPLVFSEDTDTNIVTIQLATNAGGTITTTATQLRDAFRLNTSITLLYAINGTGAAALSTASVETSGGSVVSEVASVFMRARIFGFKMYDIDLEPGDCLYGRNDDQNVGGFSNPDFTIYMSFKDNT